jgi:hypothetical protein
MNKSRKVPFYEMLSAREYYGKHATGAVLLRNGYPEYHDETHKVKAFYALLAANKFKAEKITNRAKDKAVPQSRDEGPLSECCGAPPTMGGIHNGDGICRRCKEHAEFTDSDGNVVEDR